MYAKTIREINADFKAKKYSCEELTQSLLTTIKKTNPQLNSFITLTAETALLAAKQADDERRQGNTNPLLGIPLAHKDNIYTQGITTTCGSKLLTNFQPTFDASIVERLQHAGTVMLGKLNMDEFAMGSSNETSFFGAVKNPWDVTCVPGGSSGGSAAAIAAKLVSIATGTDTGGSTRLPAAFCGVTGLKPTLGRISRFGIVPFSNSIDHVGVLANCAYDIALILQAIAGFDTRDPNSAQQPVADYLATLTKPWQQLKIGLVKEYFTTDIDPSIAQQLNNAVALLEKHGAIITEISLPHSSLAVPTYCVLTDAECSANFVDNLVAPLDRYTPAERSANLGEEVKRRIIAGVLMRSGSNFGNYFLQAQKVRRLIANDFTAAFRQVDVILGPTAATTAFALNSKTRDPIKMYLSDMYTVAASLAGLPAISVPIGFVANLPVGMQLIGKPFAEGEILNVAHQYQQYNN